MARQTKPIQVSRNPFARESLMRQVVRLGIDTYHNQTCRWCGSTSQPKHSGHARLFRYSISPDGGYDSTINGLFCSISCMRTYHDVN